MKWIALRFIYRMGTAVVVGGLFAILAFLFSEQFIAFLKYKQSVSCGIIENHLLSSIFVCCIVYVVGWILFNVACPPAIKNYKNFDEFKEIKRTELNDLFDLAKHNLKAKALKEVPSITVEELEKTSQIMLDALKLKDPDGSSPRQFAKKRWEALNEASKPQRYICTFCSLISAAGLVFIIGWELFNCA